MLVRCLYASRAVAPLGKAQVTSILTQSRQNNPVRGITGILCFTDDIFIQVLEGGRDEVCALFSTIARDDRHAGVQILTYAEIAERRFGNWSMGQVNMAKLNTSLLLKYSEKPVLNPFATSGTATMALLEELVATAAIINRGA
jgi:hypothetical protein